MTPGFPRFVGGILALGLCLWLPLIAGGAGAASVDCRPVEHRGHDYTVCTVDLGSTDLRLFWRDPDGEPYTTFGAVADDLARRGETLSFAMNAGMFDPDRAPVGLYVEDGERLVDANTRSGRGNFHLKPNGIFYWGEDGAGVMETERFLRRRPATRFATQSGPMLVIDGAIHPRFLPASDSLKIRNGVGIRDANTVVFALSEDRVNFYEFATLFRDALGCDDALFLDGSLSRLYSPELGRTLSGWYGPIVGAVER
jgi:uncharacterized protein YigE (DUF2233 family)